MTNKEMKNLFVLAMTVVLMVVGIWTVIDNYMFSKNTYTVDQYTFKDGSKITVDWNVYEDSNQYKNVRYFKGVINDNGYIETWLMSAEQWYKLIYERGGENYAQYCATLTEWRW